MADSLGAVEHGSAPLTRRDSGSARGASIQTYARVAGVLMLVSIVAGGFGEGYVPSRIIISSDAAATARNFVTMNGLFRWGFAAYLVEASCDIGLALLFYVLLRPVQRDVALLSAFFGLMATALYAVAEFLFFSPMLLVRGAEYLKTFSPDQLNTLALFLVKLFRTGGGLFLVFYGIATLLRGYLIFRSGYLPSILGLLMILAGAGFTAMSFALVLAPAYAFNLLLVPMIFAGVPLTLWLLVKGVDVRRWEEKAAAARGLGYA